MRRSLAATAAALMVAGCGGGDGGTSPSDVASIAVSPSTFSLPTAGTQQMAAVASDSRGTVLNGVSIRWSVSPATVASITAAGLVTAVASGNATITAAAGNATGTSSAVIFASGGGGVLVTMPGDIFAPFEVTVPVGGVVSWEFPAREHNVVFNRTGNGAPADIPVTARQTVSRRFDTAGSFPYDCTLHPGMTGKITVTR